VLINPIDISSMNHMNKNI